MSPWCAWFACSSGTVGVPYLLLIQVRLSVTCRRSFTSTGTGNPKCFLAWNDSRSPRAGSAQGCETAGVCLAGNNPSSTLLPPNNNWKQHQESSASRNQPLWDYALLVASDQSGVPRSRAPRDHTCPSCLKYTLGRKRLVVSNSPGICSRYFPRHTESEF